MAKIEPSGRRNFHGRMDLSGLKMVSEVETDGITIKNASLCWSLLAVVIDHVKVELLCISSGPLLPIEGSPRAINVPQRTASLPALLPPLFAPFFSSFILFFEP